MTKTRFRGRCLTEDPSADVAWVPGGEGRGLAWIELACHSHVGVRLH